MLLQATNSPVDFGRVFYSHRLSDVRGRKEEKQRDSATGAPNVVFREKGNTVRASVFYVYPPRQPVILCLWFLAVL